MSGGRVFQEAVRLVSSARLPLEVERNVTAVLEAARRKGEPAQMIYECAHAAGLPRELLLARCAGLYFLVSTVNVCDDLVDGDVDYLSPAHRLGPPAQALLHTLAIQALSRAGVTLEALARASELLVHVAAGAQVEVLTQAWTADRYKELAEQTGGLQWAAYLHLLWCGTPLAALGERFGTHAACAAYVAEDLRSSDTRFTSLTDAGQRDVLSWAEGHLQELEPMQLPPTALLRAAVAPLLEAARAAQHAGA